MTASATDNDTSKRTLRRGEVAELVGVDPRTVWEWAVKNRIPSTRTPTGERRYLYSDVAPYIPPAAAEVQAG
jgi:excisionase family DNA binding protein